jgi:transcriptional regulator with XRE-family HTH domain
MIYETHLRDIRRTQRLTLRQLSEISGVSFSEIDQIERYNVDPRISTAVLLAKSLKCGLDDLFKFNK